MSSLEDANWRCTLCPSGACADYIVRGLRPSFISVSSLLFQALLSTPGLCICEHSETAHTNQPELPQLPPKGGCPATGCLQFQVVSLHVFPRSLCSRIN